ncbi:rhomboid family intramembrane serine protease [Sulfitobacter donghicola]|uniref:Protease n=1 Tax=Sulfitobacter donghicola DSW-25 = KCTC 12864 = JCM 14565 TaxID=1300350 RepID=A0A073IUM6_9RHOB|nr:rhomboid family intramembrane serine protease [Sulfitobacter donghicola]KEJ89077.1 protease [Sulfitobacter donghicola DSW-25 = KCTC 12864 = JCM 14565]KIN67347.1 Rhomboid family protein [Sulfitobacter donghicola DSW-25 = KCTC 12864 = JCM 14565]
MSDEHETEFESPFNAMPVVVVILFLIMAGIELTLTAAEAGLVGGPEAIGWRLGLVRDWGFSGDLFDAMLAQGYWAPEHLARFVTYPFIHLSFTHALIAIVLMLALGKLAAEVMGPFAMVFLFVMSGIGGALVYALLLDDPVWLVGAYPSVYGLIGGYSFLMWRRLGATGGQQMQAFSLIAMLMGLQLVWSLFSSVGYGWVAEFSGFVCGFFLSFLCAPGEWARILRKMRQR